MCKRFEVQLELGQHAIEDVVLPKRSRDELPPLLKGLRWIFKTPEINEAIFEFLGDAVIGSDSETGEVVPLVDRLLNGYGEGNLQSISFDKGFSSQEDRRSQADHQRESATPWRKIKDAHSAVESGINSLSRYGKVGQVATTK